MSARLALNHLESLGASTLVIQFLMSCATKREILTQSVHMLEVRESPVAEQDQA